MAKTTAKTTAQVRRFVPFVARQLLSLTVIEIPKRRTWGIRKFNSACNVSVFLKGGRGERGGGRESNLFMLEMPRLLSLIGE